MRYFYRTTLCLSHYLSFSHIVVLDSVKSRETFELIAMTLGPWLESLITRANSTFQGVTAIRVPVSVPVYL